MTPRQRWIVRDVFAVAVFTMIALSLTDSCRPPNAQEPPIDLSAISDPRLVSFVVDGRSFECIVADLGSRMGGMSCWEPGQ